MKTVKLILGILLVYASTTISGQKVCTIANLCENILYRGIKNPIGISVSDIPNDHLKIILSDSLCKIEKLNNNNYLITPTAKTSLLVVLTVMNYQNGKEELIAKYTFRVKRVPPPEIYLGSWKKGGKIIKPFIFSSPYIYATKAPGFDYNIQFKVLGFTMKVNDSIGHSFISESNKFTDEQLNIIRDMLPGQSFTISDIKIDGPDWNGKLNSELLFTIE